MRRIQSTFEGARVVAVLAGVMCLSACGAEVEVPKPSGASMAAAPIVEKTEDGMESNQPPVVQNLRLNPTSPLPGGEVAAEFQAWDPDGDSIRTQIVWSVDGRVIDRGDHRQIALGNERKGARIEVEVVALDGKSESEPVRAAVSVGNQLPVVDAVYLEPREVWSGVEVLARPQASDADGDPVEFDYRWSVAGRVVGTKASFDTTGMKRGDEIELGIRASDGTAEGSWKRVRIPLLNAPPTLPDNPRFTTNSGAFQHTLQATDADGDRALRFRLVRGPMGMTVDALSGLVSWRPAGDQDGIHQVEVAVSDPHGDSSSLRFQLEVDVSASPPASGS